MFLFLVIRVIKRHLAFLFYPSDGISIERRLERDSPEIRRILNYYFSFRARCSTDNIDNNDIPITLSTAFISVDPFHFYIRGWARTAS